VILTATAANGNVNQNCLMSFKTFGTGATALTAGDSTAVNLPIGNVFYSGTAVYTVSSMNQVATTFTAQYRATGNTCTFRLSSIVVIPR
jgi:hypothetical protein